MHKSGCRTFRPPCRRSFPLRPPTRIRRPPPPPLSTSPSRWPSSSGRSSEWYWKKAVTTKAVRRRALASARQLRGSEAFAFFAATAGIEFEEFQHTLQQEGDMVKIYIADSLGSVIAEKTADCMEVALAEYIQSKNWKHTNRYSPGYCGWHVSEQQKLFPLFPVTSPCGIRLTDSSLMIPIKSVSGVIGVGTDVRKLEYTCGLCTYENCYRKRKHQ